MPTVVSKFSRSRVVSGSLLTHFFPPLGTLMTICLPSSNKTAPRSEIKASRGCCDLRLKTRQMNILFIPEMEEKEDGEIKIFVNFGFIT